MTTDNNTDGLFPYVALGSVDEIDLDTNKCTEIGFW